MRITTLHPAPLDRRERRDLRTLGRFIALFCKDKHGDQPHAAFALDDIDPQVIFGRRLPVLCPDCAGLLSHAIVKRLRCPLDPKPMCNRCPSPCYAADYRPRIREVMRHSGPRMILRGRLDYLVHMKMR